MASITKDTTNHVWTFTDTITSNTYNVVFDTLNKFLDAKIKATLTVQSGTINKPTITDSNLLSYFTNDGTASSHDMDLQPQVTNTGGFIAAHPSSSPVLGDKKYYNIIRGEGQANTANVVISNTDGSNEGINISSIVGTVADAEPTSGYYLSFTGSGSSKIKTTGWMTAGTALAAASKTRYFPITRAVATATKTSGSITPTATVSSNATLSNTNSSGVSVTATGNGSVSNLAIAANITTAGYAPQMNNFATASGLSIAAAGTPATDTRYLTAVTIPSGKNFAVTTSGTTNITAGISGTTTQGAINIVAYPASGTTAEASKTIVNNGRWVETTVSAADTWYYGKVKAGAMTITTSSTNDGMSTYFNTGSASDKNVTITPKYTNTAGYKTATTAATNNQGVTYWKIKTASMTQNKVTTLNSAKDAINTRANASWGTGWITEGTIAPATFTNTKDTDKAEDDYIDISNTSDAPILSSGGFLYINRGYVDDLKISLAKLVPDSISGKTMAPANYILTGYAAFDGAGTAINGSMQIYNGAYTVS